MDDPGAGVQCISSKRLIDRIDRGMPEPRVHAPARADVGEDERDGYDAVSARIAQRGDTEPSPYISALLTTPVIGTALNDVGRAIRLAPARSETYSYGDFELVVHVLGIDAGFIEHHHVLDALAQGVRPEALEALLRGRDDALTQDERWIVDFARRVVDRTMTDEAWEAVRAIRGQRATVELSLIAGFVWSTMCWQRAWGVSGASDDEVEAMLAAHRAGTLELPDHHTAVRAAG